jgi:hypothetical protein
MFIQKQKALNKLFRANKNLILIFFFHPDFTVGFGFSPNQPSNFILKLFIDSK